MASKHDTEITSSPPKKKARPNLAGMVPVASSPRKENAPPKQSGMASIASSPLTKKATPKRSGNAPSTSSPPLEKPQPTQPGEASSNIPKKTAAEKTHDLRQELERNFPRARSTSSSSTRHSTRLSTAKTAISHRHSAVPSRFLMRARMVEISSSPLWSTTTANAKP